MRHRITLLLWSLWLGVGVGVAFVAIPAVFATPREGLPAGQPGSIAQAILLRYFLAQGVLAVALALIEGPAWLARRVVTPRWRPATFGCLLASCVASILWLHPALSSLHQARHDPAASAPQQAAAAARFRSLHGTSQGLNLATLIAVLAHWAAVARPSPQAPRPPADPTHGR